MHVSLETIRSHIDYTAWGQPADSGSCGGVEAYDELTRDFGSADKSVLGTLLHVYGGDYAWIERNHGVSITTRPYDQHASLSTLQTAWPQVWDRWKGYVGALTEDKSEAGIAYTTFKGVPYSTPAWQIILHVVNHGTHHRGQAAGFIRSMGKTPPVLDLTEYYRSLG